MDAEEVDEIANRIESAHDTSKLGHHLDYSYQIREDERDDALNHVSIRLWTGVGDTCFGHGVAFLRHTPEMDEGYMIHECQQAFDRLAETVLAEMTHEPHRITAGPDSVSTGTTATVDEDEDGTEDADEGSRRLLYDYDEFDG